jgi:hypothetical protein
MPYLNLNVVKESSKLKNLLDSFIKHITKTNIPKNPIDTLKLSIPRNSAKLYKKQLITLNKSLQNLDGLTKIIARAYLDKLKFNILNQTFQFSPLSQIYLNYKIKKSYYTGFFLRTGYYYNSLTVLKTKDGYKVGFNDYLKIFNDPNKQAQIAYVLEYGSVVKNIKSRPLWRYTLTSLQEQINSGKLDIIKEIKDSLLQDNNLDIDLNKIKFIR